MITCETSDLLAILKNLKRIKASAMPILDNAKITAENGRVTLSRTDMDIWANHTLQGDIERDFSCLLPVEAASKLCAKLPKNSRVRIEKTDTSTKLTSGKIKAEFQTQAVEEYPTPFAWLSPDREPSYVDSLVLEDAITRTLFAASADDTRYNLCGVYLHVAKADEEADEEKKQLTVVGTNGHELSLRTLPYSGAKFPGAIIPTAGAKEIVALAHSSKKRLSLIVDDHVLFVKEEDDIASFQIRLIDGYYPDYRQVIPTISDKRFEIQKKDLVEALNVAKTFTTDKSSPVRLDFGAEGQVTLTCQNLNGQKVETSVSGTYSGDPLSVAVNATYLEGLLKYLDGDLKLSMTDNLSPIKFTDDFDSLIVLMPMRL